MPTSTSGRVGAAFYAIAKLVVLILLLPAVAILRLLRPFVLIRVGPLISHRIGHFAFDVELYLCERAAGLQPRFAMDVFFHSHPVCNQQLRLMVDRALRVWAPARWIAWANGKIPGGAAHVVDPAVHLTRDTRALMAASPPHLAFTPAELERGGRELVALGVGKGEEHVCILARDPAYLAQTLAGYDFRYHSYRDVPIADLVPAAEELARRGRPVLRMGAKVLEPIPSRHPRIIDYAWTSRTDFLDIYLGATCRFCLCDSAGYLTVPHVFRRPLALHNWVPLSHVLSWGPRDLYIPKLYWSRERKRVLGFREMLGFEFLRTEQFEASGLELRANTADEVRELVVEMEDRLAGTWKEEPGDEDLQQRLKALFVPGKLHGVINSRMGAAFLRRHADLLE